MYKFHTAEETQPEIILRDKRRILLYNNTSMSAWKTKMAARFSSTLQKTRRALYSRAGGQAHEADKRRRELDVGTYGIVTQLSRAVWKSCATAAK